MPPDPQWLPHPEWPSDENYTTRVVNWSILVDTIKKSMMTNQPLGHTVLKSPHAIAAMIEARTWLMDDSTELAPKGRYNVFTCLKASMISHNTLKRLLRGLWLRQRSDIAYTIRKSARRAREGIKAKTRARRLNGPKHGPDKNWVRIKRLCDEALKVHNESNRWAGVE